MIVLGDAVYDVPGITHQGSLDGFWSNPEAPDMTLYEAFKQVLHSQCLVRGGLASESATRILIENSVERLLTPVSPTPTKRTRRRKNPGPVPVTDGLPSRPAHC